MIRKFKTLSSDDTEEFAHQIGVNLIGGECIEFVSDLGGGKTTFVKGLALGSGSKDNVSSPTFTISKIYNSPAFSIHHYDLYRLGEAGILSEDLSEALTDNSCVTLIEWGQSVKDILPNDRIKIVIDKVADNADARIFTVEYTEKLSYILEGV